MPLPNEQYWSEGSMMDARKKHAKMGGDVVGKPIMSEFTVHSPFRFLSPGESKMWDLKGDIKGK